ncbi:OmpA family protein [Pedobacter aquatilis]|uniref:OmpA family protein n=1 Tax=Pedobacter aquatilis TaxID=351343 RepID=UPI00292FBFD2|nr:OmpA family protein [Pedobacter aquatilis]
MKKYLPSIYITLALSMKLLPVQAQYVLKEADGQFALFNYSRAIELYQKAYLQKQSLHAAERLAESYRLNSNFEKAAHWYSIVVKMPESKQEDIFNYAQVLQQNARYGEAKAVYLAYFEKSGKSDDVRKTLALASCDSAISWMAKPKNIKLRNLEHFNSAQSDWGARRYESSLVFSSDRENPQLAQNLQPRFLKFDGAKLPDRKVYGWTGNGYLKLYQGQDDAAIAQFPIPTGPAYHVGPASFSTDGKTAFFTLTHIPEKLDKGKTVTTIHTEVYYSSKDSSGRWGKPEGLEYNNALVYSLADPYLSADGNRLYFSSDMPGGMGGSDIYYIDRSTSGEWGKPQNLAAINSQGNERTPFIDGKGHLFFASDGRIGMGGLDIFVHDPITGNIDNLGYPANSPQDDFAYFSSDKLDEAYLSSNREGGKGSDDLYSLDPFHQRSPAVNPLSGPLQNTSAGNTDRSVEDRKPLPVPQQQNEPLQALNADIRLENIYYDFDRYAIRSDAAAQLDKVVKIMLENADIYIQLSSHTDSRGDDAYNLKLSQRRAEAAAAYLIAKGISAIRVAFQGYGETRLLNRCTNGVHCSAAEHQLNRRTALTVKRIMP